MNDEPPSIPDDRIVGAYVRDGKWEPWFDEGAALAALLLSGDVALNSRWFKEADKEDIDVFVNCNDVFAWGCADAEALPFDEIERLWAMFRRDPTWGPAIWCIQQRKQMPQKPVERLIREAGIWNLDGMDLGPNTMDDEVKAAIVHHFSDAIPRPSGDSVS